ncbi:uncharacterized protein [Diabrotica undecimpunctata]|uniref:uncharacterized protein n=1 Tax=Diabrotica undecimpunctata TaxID=50387 RepID=UPI003B63511E
MVEVKKIKSDITVLTETKKKGQGSQDIGGFIHIYSGVEKDKKAQAGVSVLVKKDLKGNLKSWEQINERIIRVSITWKGHDFEIIGIYASSENVSKAAKHIFYETLSELIENINSRKEIVLLGDFNAWTATKTNDKVVGKYGDAKTNENGEHLIEFCKQHSLKILNGFYQHKNIHKYTWVQPTRNTKSIIDYVITKQETHKLKT